MSLLSARGVAKAYGARMLFESVTLTVREGERVGLLGVNGTGKSTLLRVLAGQEPCDVGVIEGRRGAKILYLPQEPELSDEETARSVIASGLAEWEAAIREYEALSEAISAEASGDAALARQAEVAESIERLGGWDRSHVVEEMAASLGITPNLDRPVGTLSGGERRRVALARVLVASPALAILDEPTNHLDADTIDWLEKYLAETFKGSVLMVTHDRWVLDAVCDRIFELDRGTLTEFEGNYTDYVEKKADFLAHEERAERNRQNLVRRETALRDGLAIERFRGAHVSGSPRRFGAPFGGGTRGLRSFDLDRGVTGRDGLVFCRKRGAGRRQPEADGAQDPPSARRTFHATRVSARPSPRKAALIRTIRDSDLGIKWQARARRTPRRPTLCASRINRARRGQATPVKGRAEMASTAGTKSRTCRAGVHGSEAAQGLSRSPPEARRDRRRSIPGCDEARCRESRCRPRR